MFILQNAYKSLLARKTQNILLLCVIFVLILLLALYTQSYRSLHTEYENLSSTIPVTGKITNENGSIENDLDINVEKATELTASKLLDSVSKTVYLYAYTGNSDMFPQIQILGCNAIQNHTGTASITYLKGYDAHIFSGNEAVVVISNQYMQQNQLSLGDDITVAAVCPEYNEYGVSFTYAAFGTITLKVVGIYEAEDIAIVTMPDLIVPADYIITESKKRDISMSYTALSFTISDPRQLNTFKEEVQKIGYLEIDFGSTDGDSYRLGDYLYLNDKVFVESATPLLRNQRLYEYLYPVFFAVIFAISFIISYISVQSRKAELATMYALGVSKRESFLTFLLEKLILNALAVIALFILSLFLGWYSIFILFICLGYFLIDTAGLSAAFFMVNKNSIMHILKSE